MKTIHFTNKKTLKVYGYKSLEVAKKYNDDFENLVEMSDELFQEFKKNRPKGGQWTAEGWVVDDDLLAQEIESEKKAERAKLMQEMQYHMLLGEEDKAREIALKIKELDA